MKLPGSVPADTLDPALRALAADMAAARKRYRLSVRTLASQIGISASALRRIENGESRRVTGATVALVLDWAAYRGYTEFAGEDLTLPLLPRPWGW